MDEKVRGAVPVIKGDKLVLDFGKTILRPDQHADSEEIVRKLPPMPGRAAPEQQVPDDEVLNRSDKKTGDE